MFNYKKTPKFIVIYYKEFINIAKEIYAKYKG